MTILPLHSYLSGGDLELVVVKLERSGGDVDAEERPGISVVDPDRRIQRQHVRRHSRIVDPGLYIEALEHDILHALPKRTINGVRLNPTESTRTNETGRRRYLDDDLRLVGLASAPEDDGEEREEDEEQEREAEVQPHVAAGLGVSQSGVVLVIVGVVVAVVAGAVEALPGGEVAGVLEGGGESGGGGLAGVVDGGAVVVGVAWGAHWAGAVRHLLDVVVGRALDVVNGPARRPGRRRLLHARHLRVRLGVHC